MAPKQPADQMLATEQNKAQQDNVEALKIQEQGDTASLMARYGTRLALANAAGGGPVSSPLVGMKA